jgi:hypothetical protein
LAGVLPIEVDTISIAELEPGRRFLERSTMLLFRSWEHERTLLPTGADSCTVQDRVGFELRMPLALVPGLAWICRRQVGWLFSHRHRRLKTAFGPTSGRAGG